MLLPIWPKDRTTMSFDIVWHGYSVFENKYYCSLNRCIVKNSTLFHRFLIVLSKKKYSLTVTVSILIENHHQTVTLTS